MMDGSAVSTSRAREVLSDCEVALVELRSASQETLRRRWITVITLLRAVGHVLDKVDGGADPILAQVCKAKFREINATKPVPEIFWKFIEEERNNILKTYTFSVRGNLNVVVPAGAIRFNQSDVVLDPTGSSRTTFRWEIMLIKEGPFAGQDPRDLVQQAINFWRDYLDDTERLVAERRKSN